MARRIIFLFLVFLSCLNGLPSDFHASSSPDLNEETLASSIDNTAVQHPFDDLISDFYLFSTKLDNTENQRESGMNPFSAWDGCFNFSLWRFFISKPVAKLWYASRIHLIHCVFII